MADGNLRSLQEHLIQLLAQESNLLLGVRQPLKKLYETLDVLEPLMADSEEKLKEETKLKETVSQTRDQDKHAADQIDIVVKIPMADLGEELKAFVSQIKDHDKVVEDDKETLKEDTKLKETVSQTRDQDKQAADQIDINVKIPMADLEEKLMKFVRQIKDHDKDAEDDKETLKEGTKLKETVSQTRDQDKHAADQIGIVVKIPMADLGEELKAFVSQIKDYDKVVEDDKETLKEDTKLKETVSQTRDQDKQAADQIDINVKILTADLEEKLMKFVSQTRDQDKHAADQIDTIVEIPEPLTADLEDKLQEETKLNEFMSQIRDKAKEAEDVIDNYVIIARQQRRKLFHFCRQVGTLQDLKLKIQDINNELSKFSDLKAYNDMVAKGSEVAEQLNRRRRTVEKVDEAGLEEDVVGLEKETEMLSIQLLEAGAHLEVVSIIGMAGIGKTTLARKIYNHTRISHRFDLKAWVFVDHHHSIDHVFREIYRSVFGKSGGHSNIIEEVVEYMKDKRFLVVLDDVRKIELLDEVKYIFAEIRKGSSHSKNKESKLLITSRIRGVGLYASRGPRLHFKQFLTEQQSCELFSKIVDGRIFPAVQEGTEDVIVAKRCGGLPLAVVIAARALEQRHTRWLFSGTQIDHCLVEKEETILGVLASYSDLPRRLKPCFLYMAAFPAHYEIPTKQLFQLWVAEGFIQDGGARTMEEVGEDYLEELIDRSMVQVSTRRTDGGVKTCRMHRLFWLWCQKKSKEEKFLENCTELSALSVSVARRLSLDVITSDQFIDLPHNHASFVRSVLCYNLQAWESNWLWCQKKSKEEKFLENCTELSALLVRVARRLSLDVITSDQFIDLPHNHASFVRSVLGYNLQAWESNWLCKSYGLMEIRCPFCLKYLFQARLWMWLYKNFRLIRVLKLGGGHILAIPDSIDSLMHLKYLKIESEALSVIPASLGNILSMQTLDLGFTSVKRLPIQIWKLRELRHVRVSGYVPLPKHSRTDVSWNLLSLSTVALNKATSKLIQKASFPNLRKLGLWYKSNSKCKAGEALAHLSKLQHLQTLKIIGTSELPSSWRSFPHDLSKVTLSKVDSLDSNTTATLGQIPNLKILKVIGTLNSSSVDPCHYEGLKFDWNVSGFPQLQILQISCLPIKEWILKEDAMPCLQSCSIRRCRYLTTIPDLGTLTDLQEIKLLEPSSELQDKLDQLQGQINCKLVVESFPVERQGVVQCQNVYAKEVGCIPKDLETIGQ